MSAGKPRSVRPPAGFLWQSPAHFIALGLGSGLIYPAPGTWGTVMGVALYPLIVLLYGLIPMGLPLPVWVLLLSLLVFLLGCHCAERAGRALGVSDHGSIVIDEIVAIWLVLLVVPATLAGWLAAFVAFRIFDIAKPWPIRWLDARVKGGFGVMVDDILAAGFAVLVLLAVQQFFPLT
ncbi:phosphatidylglycerophosphatase A family protein [Chitinilyticum piscinae]|uniref:Phosphatidylglycerophosphatase A n=1 Tax=Chitinilyticum piscinae TaxID=2866724 RepID=A0A8J7FFY5_9NEIS|nr:phosphatidylglycerophosphatase A [Chitinilyticum piscinae]MBE9608673.1 phosphatidylglycerophosphatase A [Chitinilyticum piscinae]